MNKTKLILSLVFVFACTAVIMAQPPITGGGTGGGAGAPIDGGITALLVGAAGLAYKKFKKN